MGDDCILSQGGIVSHVVVQRPCVSGDGGRGLWETTVYYRNVASCPMLLYSDMVLRRPFVCLVSRSVGRDSRDWIADNEL